MSCFRMSVVKSDHFDRALSACQMSFGCIYEHGSQSLGVVAFESGDMEVIIDTLKEAGSVYLGEWKLM